MISITIADDQPWGTPDVVIYCEEVRSNPAPVPADEFIEPKATIPFESVDCAYVPAARLKARFPRSPRRWRRTNLTELARPPPAGPPIPSPYFQWSG